MALQHIVKKTAPGYFARRWTRFVTRVNTSLRTTQEFVFRHSEALATAQNISLMCRMAESDFLEMSDMHTIHGMLCFPRSDRIIVKKVIVGMHKYFKAII